MVWSGIWLAIVAANILLMCLVKLSVLTVMYTTTVPFMCDLHECEYFDSSFIDILTY